MAKQQSAKTNKGERSARANGKKPKKSPKTNHKTGRTVDGYNAIKATTRETIRANPFENLLKKVLDKS